jgi:hypothetical protein
MAADHKWRTPAEQTVEPCTHCKSASYPEGRACVMPITVHFCKMLHCNIRR